jgi:type III restriction enzyme
MPDMQTIVETVTNEIVRNTIDIPRILVVPKGGATVGFKPFELDLSSVTYKPVERDLFIQHLRTRQQETVHFMKSIDDDARPEDALVGALVDFEDISYDEHADLLYDLAGQVVRHIRSYLKADDEVSKVVIYHAKELSRLIHAQMAAHHYETADEYETVVNKGFTELKETAFIANRDSASVDFNTSEFDKKNIGRMVFTGFSKSLYSHVKFDSDTERRFAAILERESEKWFRPLKGQFQIVFSLNGEQFEYVPDFVAECAEVIYMIETKARNEMDTEEVQRKKEAALRWCSLATEHSRKNAGKPWKYLLVPHDEVKDNMSLEYFE